MTGSDACTIHALAFDVFGTVVDWRGSIVREGEALAQAKGLQVDWAGFADAWRAGYQPAMQRVRSGELPWTRLDDLHRMILDGLLPQFGLDSLAEDEIERLNRVWHRLLPWPDAVAGLERLRTRFVLATLSNGNVALLVNMAKHAGLPWDCILSAELFGHYKPDREVYTGAAHLLGLVPEQVMMVAAHPPDLRAAQQAGLRTAYVPRPLEYGRNTPPEPIAQMRYDWVAEDFLDLAAKLGT
jgi:2-haloacid dehalogenase